MRKQIIENIMTEYNRKRLQAAKDAEIRKEEIYERVPNLEELDRGISLLSIRLSKLFLSKAEDLNEEMSKIRREINDLKKQKKTLYEKYNIPENFIQLDYQCKLCNDSGYTPDGKRCKCFNKQIIDYLYKMSNMTHMLNKENFDTFDINVYSNEIYQNEKLTPKQNMYKILETCEDFCNNFSKVNINLLFYGGTGLGKTFMCNCIAKTLIDKEKTVLYQTAFNLFEIIENHKFNKINETEENRINYNMIFECELLIIDDLGTEFNNSFTNGELFNIINERLITEKKTIISTNLSLEQLAETYSDRIMSRVFNNFVPLKFFGKVVRWETK
jgi:DNA replication protein DnaC